MTYAIFASTPAAYLIASKLFAEGESVVVGEAQPSDRFPSLEKYPREKLVAALSKVKDKADYFILSDEPMTLPGFAMWAPLPPVEPLGEYSNSVCVYLIAREGKAEAAALIIENDKLGAGNLGPDASSAQVLARTLPLDSAAVRLPTIQPGKELAIYEAVFLDVSNAQSTVSATGPATFQALIPLASLFESYGAMLAALRSPKTVLPEGFGATVGQFDLPDYVASPRAVSQGAGSSVTEAVDAAYENAEGLYRPRFDFLGSYEGSILERYNAACGTIIDDEPVDVEGEREALLAKQQDAIKVKEEELTALQKNLQENHDATISRLEAEKQAEIAAIREEVTSILHEADPTTTR